LREAFCPIVEETPAPLATADLFCSSAPVQSKPKIPVVVIVPVFNAAEDVTRLLARLADTTEDHHKIILIDDGSDDPRIAPMLAAFAQRFPARVMIETFGRNKGFVAAVNHGFDLALKREGHIVLLNSDTLPPEKWIDRLLAPILSDERVASVTPVSNTAEIASVPAQGINTPVTLDVVDRIDAVARRFDVSWSTVEIPTGIGFAMAINRVFLARLGTFDRRFGRGYGEEVDWSQRARAIGGRHVLATSVFIGHSGGASFGSIDKQKRLQANNRIISARYPTYDREVQDWAMAAPHALQRFALSIAWLDAISADPIPVFMAHALGGGAEMALRRQVDEILATGAPGVVVLRTGGDTPWRFEIEGAGFRHACRLRDMNALKDMLAPLVRRRVVYSCGVGAQDPRTVPEALMALAASGSDSLELQLHDYFPISPSYCLLDDKGQYCGVPAASDTGDTDGLPSLTHAARAPVPSWRELWRPVISRANCVTAYSKSSAEIFLQAYPCAAQKLVIAPHDLPRDMPGRLSPGGQTIGILGGINQAKGAAVVLSLARHLKKTGSNRKIVILGDLDPNFRLPKPHIVTGRYDRADIERYAAKHDIGVWFIPSIWPETFSFTTREALSTGLPVLAFDLGAQGEAVREARNGHALTCDPTEIESLAASIEAQFQGA
jgi:GT2 family glycosyltransferase